jgi:hypothetical protein
MKVATVFKSKSNVQKMLAGPVKPRMARIKEYEAACGHGPSALYP